MFRGVSYIKIKGTSPGAQHDPWQEAGWTQPTPKEQEVRLELVSELAMDQKQQMVKLEPILGYRLRVVERTGRNLLTSFPQTRTWSGMKCGRQECITCNQGGEELPNCTQSSIVYESVCTLCNPGVVKKGELEKVKDGHPSLYVGESSRSIQERAGALGGCVQFGSSSPP